MDDMICDDPRCNCRNVEPNFRCWYHADDNKSINTYIEQAFTAATDSISFLNTKIQQGELHIVNVQPLIEEIETLLETIYYRNVETNFRCWYHMTEPAKKKAAKSNMTNKELKQIVKELKHSYKTAVAVHIHNNVNLFSSTEIAWAQAHLSSVANDDIHEEGE